MSRDEPRRQDWRMIACAFVAVALAASTAAVIVSDEQIARVTFVAPRSATPSPSHLVGTSPDSIHPIYAHALGSRGPQRAR